MTDRELLELAAKAAGIEIEWGRWLTGRAWLTKTNTGDLSPWCPLSNDGDALRLLAQLDLELFFNTMPYDMCVCVSKGNRPGLWSEPFGPDKLAAARRAIVRAAAEIGGAQC